MNFKLSTSYIILITIIFPFSSNATLINYTASGILGNNDTQLTISGNMLIDDTLRLWSGTNSPGALAPVELGPFQYSYFISEYSFVITDTSSPSTAYSFSGSSGSFYMERQSDGMHDNQWSLNDGSGDWTEWFGEVITFYNRDMTHYDVFNDMHNPAPIICLTDLFSWNPISSSMASPPDFSTDILLTRTTPVPEPSTMLLLGTSLVALIGIRTKKTKIKLFKQLSSSC